MKRFYLGALALAATLLSMSSPSLGQGNSCSGGAIAGMVIGGTTTAGACYYIKVNSDGSINTTAASPGTDQDVNLVGINGVAPVAGSGTATGALRVELPTNGTGTIATVGAVTS